MEPVRVVGQHALMLMPSYWSWWWAFPWGLLAGSGVVLAASFLVLAVVPVGPTGVLPLPTKDSSH